MTDLNMLLSCFREKMSVKVVPKDMAATHECAFCGQHYMSSSGLEEHIKKRHSSGLMTCDTCGKPFRDGAANDHKTWIVDLSGSLMNFLIQGGAGGLAAGLG